MESEDILENKWMYPVGFFICVSILIIFLSIYTDKVPYLSKNLPFVSHDPSYGFFESMFLTIAIIMISILFLLGIGLAVALCGAALFFGHKTLLLICGYLQITIKNIKNKFYQSKKVSKEEHTQSNKEKKESTLSNIT